MEREEQERSVEEGKRLAAASEPVRFDGEWLLPSKEQMREVNNMLERAQRDKGKDEIFVGPKICGGCVTR